MPKWREVKISDLGDVVGGATPSTSRDDYYNGEIPWITPKDLSDHKSRFINRGERNITLEGLRSCSTQILPKNTVLFSSRAPIGYVAIAANDLCTNQGFKSVIPNDKTDFMFLFYLLKYNKDAIENMASGTTFKEVSGATMRKIVVRVPDLETQKKIAKVLSALDDKIELNNQINKNLEEQAQALYNSWFVDFEPFGGVVPADWAQADIYSLAEVIYGAPFASKYFNNTGDGIPIIRIRDLEEQKFITYTTEKHSKGYLLQKGDIVVGMDGEFRPYIWGNSQAWLNQRVCVFKNKRPNGKAFLYYTIKPLLLAIEQTQVATTVIHIGKKDFDLFKVTLPANEILDKFDNITTPIIDQIVQNTFENKILCDIRETLLPKLMSGEIDVDNVEI